MAFQIRQGLAGLYVGGSSGEAMAQSIPERADYLRLVAPPSSEFRARFLGLLLADSVTVAGLSFVA